MSKYFEATLKARSVGPATMQPDAQVEAQVGDPELAGSASPDVVPEDSPSKNGGLNTGVLELEKYRKFQMALENVPQVQFGPRNSTENVEESYRALRTRLLRLQSARSLQSIVITSAMPGEGKTLTSLNLALCCAQLHELRVLLIDGDVRSGGLTRKLALPGEPGLTNILSGECKPEEGVVETNIPNLFLLSSGPRATSPAELFAARAWRDFMIWCNKNFALILVDTPPLLNISDAELITAECDGVLMVVRALQTKRQALERCAGHVDSKKLLGLVYNGTDASTRHGYE